VIFDRTASACLRSVGGAPANVGTAPRQRGGGSRLRVFVRRTHGIGARPWTVKFFFLALLGRHVIRPDDACQNVVQISWVGNVCLKSRLFLVVVPTVVGVVGISRV